MREEAQFGADVDVWSPDRSVRLLATVEGELAVEVRDLHRHTESSLERQVSAAVRVTLAALQQAQERRLSENALPGHRLGENAAPEAPGSWS